MRLATTSKGCWRRWRPRSSTTSSAGRSARRAGPRRRALSYEALFADLADGKVTSKRRLYGEDFLVDDSVWRGRAPGRPFGIDGRNRPLEFRLLHVVEFDAGGDIARENVWIDLAAIQAQLA